MKLDRMRTTEKKTYETITSFYIFCAPYPNLPPLAGDHEVAAKLTSRLVLSEVEVRRMGVREKCKECYVTEVFNDDKK